MERKTIYALGFFDGVHLGHQALLTACRELAGEMNCHAGVVTFTTHPEGILLGEAPKLISSGTDRRRLLEGFAMETVVELPFDAKLRSMPWEKFIFMLRETYGAGGFICGDDFRFGYQGRGNGAILQAYCREWNIPCRVIPEQLLDGERISSTRIRGLLEAGELERANRCLGHPHILSGEVVSGRHLGRTIGVPTANLQPESGVILPKRGVYACNACVGGHIYPAVTNIGIRPTVEGHHVTVEPWLLGFAGDLYGQTITLEFHKFLREERKFDSLDALKEQIQADAAETYRLLK